MVFIATAMFSCQSEKQKIESRVWKYSAGFYIGDFVNFNSDEVKLDDHLNIYRKGKKCAKVLKVSSTRLKIQSNKGEKGSYYILEYLED